MSKSARISSVLFLIAVYCFAISIVSSPEKFGIKEKISHTAQHISAAEIGMFFKTLQLKKLNDVVDVIHTVSLKKSLNKFSLITKTIHQLIGASYAQYRYISRDYLISLKKSSLIFPFHYHW